MYSTKKDSLKKESLSEIILHPKKKRLGYKGLNIISLNVV